MGRLVMQQSDALPPYRSTESKSKGGAQEMYVTYDLKQTTRGGTAIYPKVKRVYIAGDVKDWTIGTFRKRSRREVYGVKIEYEKTRPNHERRAFTAHRGARTYQVEAAHLGPTTQHFTQIVQLPPDAQHINFYTHELPARYRAALQDIE